MRVKNSKTIKYGEIRIVLLTLSESWSGVEVHTKCLVEALLKRGHVVSIVEIGTRLFSEKWPSHECSVIHYDLGTRPFLEQSINSLSFISWRRSLKELKADIAILVKGNFFVSNFTMEAALRLTFPCFMVIEHMHSPLQKKDKIRFSNRIVPNFGLWWYRKKISGFLRSFWSYKVICVSNAVASTLKNDYHYSPSKLLVYHGGVDTELFCPNLSHRKSSRQSWEIPEKSFVFGTVGRISPMKNHELLIKAFVNLYEAFPTLDVWLVIVGEGPLKSSLEAVAHANQAGSRIIFTGFSTTTHEIYPAFDVFCLPSSGEAFGLSLLEAMSCGTPVIASDVGGVTEILSDTKLGWLIQPGDEMALLSAMSSAVSSDADRLQRISSNVREHVLHNFNAKLRWNKLVDGIESSFFKFNL